MDEGESILGAIYEDDNLEDGEDVEMLDVEEGEFVERDSSLRTNLEQSSGRDANAGNQGSQSKSRRRRANKKKKKRSALGPNVININRFVSDTCKQLKERKSYMVCTAVGCLGVSALNDLTKEVDAIQACGGQMTANGRHHWTGGGVLWSIIKARGPGAYKEIMKKIKEFEATKQKTNVTTNQRRDGISIGIPDDSQYIPPDQSESEEAKQKPICDRISVPVSYDDLLGEDPKNDLV